MIRIMCRVSGGQSYELLWSLLPCFRCLVVFFCLFVSFLISNSSDLPFGTQGRSWTVKSCRQEMGYKKTSLPRSLESSPVSVSQYNL